MDWERLRAKTLPSPFVPDVSRGPSGIHCHRLTQQTQTQKANFDVSHELDEFMMVEKPLTHHKRKKANMDPEKMRPEMRQLEEQCVAFPLALVPPRAPVTSWTLSDRARAAFLVPRFTIYDFTKPNRVSYYPHNETIVARVSRSGDGEDEAAAVVQSATNTLLPTATIVDRSTAGSPTPDQVSPRVILARRSTPSPRASDSS